MVGRILAIDFGKKRVGLAVTDPLQMIANGLKTVQTNEIYIYLQNYFVKEEVDTIVIGFPKTLNNKPSEASKYIDPFIKKIKKLFPDKIVTLMDERFTSKMALQTMIDGGLKKKQRKNKGLIDTISATIILQSYLEYRKNKSAQKSK